MTIRISARKYDGTEQKNWSARLVVNKPPLMILDARFAEAIQHDLLGTISKDTISTEYYWLDRWYNVFRFGDANNALKAFYCNVAVPPLFDGSTLSYVDLDIDIVVRPDFSYEVLDHDDFETNAKLYAYPQRIRKNAHSAEADLIELIERRSFPFDQ